VFWVHAGNSTRFIEGYREIALRVGLLKGHEQDVDVLPLVKRWLSDEHNGTWQLIVDNCDETKYFFDNIDGDLQSESTEERRAISDFIPQSGNGTVLFTSRNRDLAVRLVGRHRSIIDLDVMSSTEAMALLETKLDSRSQGEHEEHSKLCEALEGFPLAISQAAAYINRMRPRMTIPRYMKLLEQSTSRTNNEHVLNGDAGDSRRDRSAKNSIVTTWQISFDHIRGTFPSAAQLLSLMSFFNRQGIPDFVLQTARMYSGGEKDDTYDAAEGMHFDADIATLQAYCLVSVDQDGTTFQMHRLVQFATKRWLELQPSNRLRWYRCAFMDLLYLHFDDHFGQYSIRKYNSLLTHALEVERDIPADSTGRTLWVSLMYHVGHHLYNIGHNSTTERILSAAAGVAEEQGGVTSFAYLQVSREWGRVLSNSGNLQAAQAKLEHVVEIASKTLPATKALNRLLFYGKLDLARNLIRQDRLDQAEGICLRMLNQTEHYSSGQISSIYDNLNFFEIERKNYTLATEYSLKRLQLLNEENEDDIDVCLCLLDLGLSAYRLEQLDEAELYVVRAWSMFLCLFGDDHADISKCLGRLGKIKEAQGYDEEALILYRTSYAGNLQWSGASHESTVFSKTALGNLAQKMGLQNDQSDITVIES